MVGGGGMGPDRQCPARVVCVLTTATLRTVKLTAQVKLLPTSEQRTALLSTMERFNAACDWIAGVAFAAGCASKKVLQERHYREIRERFGLSSQMAIRAIAKVCEVYKRDRSIRPTFRPRGSIVYDQRILSFQPGDRVSILTLNGRIELPFQVGDHHRALLNGKRGQVDLILRKGNWYLYVTVSTTALDDSLKGPTDVLGVDLGIVNLGTDSDGERYTGADVEGVRVRYQTLRDQLQPVNTRQARRKLMRLAGKEARFRSHVNHTISKKLVAKAKDTGRAIALEDLTGIRDRVTVRKSQRARHSGWSFYQLRFFLSYKAQLDGVPLVLVDPRGTSTTCPNPLCQYRSRSNRKSQSEFVCKSCGFADHADVVGAINVREVARTATVTWPIVRVVDVGNTGAHGRVPRSRLRDNVLSALRKAPSKP
jgi:putative transposase